MLWIYKLQEEKTAVGIKNIFENIAAERGWCKFRPLSVISKQI